MHNGHTTPRSEDRCGVEAPSHPPRHSVPVPLPAMNEALVGWLMTAPDAETVPLTLEDFLGRPSWHQRAEGQLRDRQGAV